MPKNKRLVAVPAPERESLHDQIGARSNVVVPIVMALFAGFGLSSTCNRNADQTGLEAARVVVDAAAVAKDDPAAARSIVVLLNTEGQPGAATALDSIIKAMDRGKNQLKPVAIPQNSDSAASQLTRLRNQTRSASPLSRGMVAPGSPQHAAVRLEVLPIPRDSQFVTLPSGERVAREEVGTLWEGAGGQTGCMSGGCAVGLQCCRLVLEHR